jgi:hypothetical protein
LIDRLAVDTPLAEFPAAFLRAKDLGWAAELIDNASSPAGPSASPPAVPRQQAQATATRATPPPFPKTPPQRAANAAVLSPLPGLPGGPPMPERLSPFRVPETKRKGERR